MLKPNPNLYAHHMPVEPAVFRATMSHWATGVTIVTSRHQGEPIGFTASSFASLSLAPPRILVCIAKRLHTYQAIADAAIFAVNILTTAQLEWGLRFAGQWPETPERFRDIATTAAITGAPILPDVLGWLDCRVHQTHDGSDHMIVIGDVLACSSTEDADPLLYYHRQWRQLKATPLTIS